MTRFHSISRKRSRRRRPRLQLLGVQLPREVHQQLLFLQLSRPPSLRMNLLLDLRGSLARPRRRPQWPCRRSSLGRGEYTRLPCLPLCPIGSPCPIMPSPRPLLPLHRIFSCLSSPTTRPSCPSYRPYLIGRHIVGSEKTVKATRVQPTCTSCKHLTRSIPSPARSRNQARSS